MRSGECLGLAWEDIDFENNTISINHTLTDIGGKHELTDPKTESSIRIIGMGQELKKILLAQKEDIEKLKYALGDNFLKWCSYQQEETTVTVIQSISHSNASPKERSLRI